MRSLLRNLYDVIRDNPYQYLLRLAWRYAVGWRVRYLSIYGLFVIANLIVSLQPIIFGKFIDYLQSSEANILRGTWIYAGAYLATVLGLWAFHWPGRLMERRLAFDISRRLLLTTYDQVIHLPLDWHREHHSGDTINRTRKAYEALRNFFDNGFAYFQTLARMVIALGALIYFSPLFGLIAAITGLILLLTILVFDRPFIEAGLETNERENSLMAGLTDNLGNITTVTTLRLGKRTSEQISGRADRIWPPFLRQTRINEYKWFTVSVIVGLMYGLITIGYVTQHYVPGEVFLVGGLVTLLGFVQQFTNMLNNLTAQYTQVVRFRTDLAAIDPILAAHERMGRPTSVGNLPRNWSSLGIKELYFRYPQAEADDPGLVDVNLRMAQGKRIALIGSSGSGKSTILALLRGLYPADRMTVTFDGRATDNPANLFEQTTLIPQTPEIFEDSVTANLTMGIPYKQEEISQALHVTVFNEVTQLLPDGLDTFLAEGGANLSGGQRQRLSIARGLLAAGSSQLLLLDEPTSSLDPRTELLLYTRLFAAYPEKTIVSTLHRLHLLKHFDWVYVMEGGRLVAEGTPAELRKNSAAFQRLWAEQ